MPELPEVETTLRGVEPVLAGQQITGVEVRHTRLRLPLDPKLPSRLVGRTVVSLKRRAKYMLIGLDNGTTLIVHLGMSGRLTLNADEPLGKHDHLVVRTAKGEIRLRDPRRFGLVVLVKDKELAGHPLLKDLGPEPLEAGFDGGTLYEALQRTGVAVKIAIMNAKVVVGVGNIYASEALFRAKISPKRAADKVTKAEAGELAAAIKEVLREAIKAGGSSLRDYRHSHGQLGYFQHNFRVYDRKGEPCVVCGTAIKSTVVGQRSTYWCPVCQAR